MKGSKMVWVTPPLVNRSAPSPSNHNLLTQSSDTLSSPVSLKTTVPAGWPDWILVFFVTSCRGSLP